MKFILPFAIALPCSLFGQSPVAPGSSVGIPPPPIRQRLVAPGRHAPGETLSDNYQLTLTIAEKDGQSTEISIVVASTQFNATLGDQNLSFSGTIAVDDEANISVGYGLNWQTPSVFNGGTNYISTAIEGSVRMKSGEEIQIIRAGTRTAKLAIKKLGPPKSK